MQLYAVLAFYLVYLVTGPGDTILDRMRFTGKALVVEEYRDFSLVTHVHIRCSVLSVTHHNDLC